MTAAGSACVLPASTARTRSRGVSASTSVRAGRRTPKRALEPQQQLGPFEAVEAQLALERGVEPRLRRVAAARPRFAGQRGHDLEDGGGGACTRRDGGREESGIAGLAHTARPMACMLPPHHSNHAMDPASGRTRIDSAPGRGPAFD